MGTITHDTETILKNALRVFVLAPATRAWLEANDPQALKQAEAALKIEPPALSPEERSREAAQRLGNAVNDTLFDNDEFAKQITRHEHRTLQQSMFRAFAATIMEWATINAYDLRNEATVKYCEKIAAALKDDLYATKAGPRLPIPYI